MILGHSDREPRTGALQTTVSPVLHRQESGQEYKLYALGSPVAPVHMFLAQLGKRLS
jgi:hypothetical protein